MKDLEEAWRWREARGVFASADPVRVFHGPVEGKGVLRALMIEKFGTHFWVVEREDGAATAGGADIAAKFLQGKGAASAVFLARPRGKVPVEVQPLFGEAPGEGAVVTEQGLRFRVRFAGTRHPGLFLDHAPLRAWLRENCRGFRVLNTFSYTGSLSVAAGIGGAQEVVTLDLSAPALEWAKENWALNSLPPDLARFVTDDYFKYLPRLQRKGELFDCVILDPPSFSRSKQGVFSTAKDLVRLHELAFDVLKSGGLLVTSVNSGKIQESKFKKEIEQAAASRGRGVSVLKRLEQPATFPWRPGHPEERYLKGFILRVT